MKSKYFNRLYILIGLVLAVLMIEGFSGGVVYAAGKAKVSVSYAGSSVLKGNSLKLTVKLKNSSSGIKKINYKSSNTSIAAVTSSGTVKGKKEGTVTITVKVRTKAGKAYSKKIKITVKCKAAEKASYMTAPDAETKTTGPGYTIDLGNGKTTVVEGDFNRTMADEIYALLNAYRAEKGLKKLERDDALAGSADIRGYETSYLFEHIRPNGMSIASLEGIKGENIAYGYKTAGAVMAAWKASSGHNANMLRDYHTKVGISVFVKKNVYPSGAVYETYHLVQVFG